jgi:hypothetical protein
MKGKWFFLIFMVMTMMSCDKCKDQPNDITEKDYSTGLWMVNEGAFNGNNASIDVRMPSGELVRDVFQMVNGFPLGDVLQRVVVANDLAYAVLNNSNKVVVFKVKTFEWVRDITNLDYPRDVAVVNGKIYIAEGAMQGKVSCYSAAGQWLSEVAVGYGPERLLFAHDQLWVLNSGGWSLDNRVQTIDVNSMSVSNSWTVGDRPVDIEYNAMDGAVYVLSSGEIQYDANWNIVGHTQSTLSRFLGLSSPTSVVVGNLGEHPRSMAWSVFDSRILISNGSISMYDGNLSLLCASCIAGEFYTVDADAKGFASLTSVPDFTSASEVELYRISDNSYLKEWAGGIGTSAVFEP